MRNDKYLLCGRAVSTHGVRGTLRLENNTDSVEVLCSLKKMYLKDGNEYKLLNVEKASRQKDMALVTFKEITTLEDAIKYKGRELFADREDIPLEEGCHFIEDLIGLPVSDIETGEVYGTVSDVITNGSRDIYVVKKKDGEFMIPGVPEFIREIVTEGDNPYIKVKLIEGMTE